MLYILYLLFSSIATTHARSKETFYTVLNANTAKPGPTKIEKAPKMQVVPT